MTRGRDVEECRIAAALYAIGALSPLESAHFEERLRSGCPLCMAEFAAYAAVADELAMVIPAQSPAPSLRRRLFDRIQAAPKVLPSGQDMTLVRSGDTSWVSLPVPGIEVRPLLGQNTVLVRMQPGAIYPSHVHRQTEQCYVLEGSVTDRAGVTAFAGDFVYMRAGSTHEPIHTETGCLFLLAYTA
jgi:anti-sigma factor ChrR (cupin superfamily)